jgi:hypothetical protein
MVEALGHLRVVGGVDSSLLYIGEKFVDAIVMRTLRARE